MIVLVVEDDPLVIFTIEAYLEGLGHEAVLAANAEEAIIRLETGFRPDLIMTDFRMPGMNGLEFLGKLRSDGIYLPTILATGYTGLVSVPDGVVLLQKPFFERDIEESILKANSH